MARRKEIAGILHGFLSSFISRNNDIRGYWGLGKLYLYAIESGTDEIEINLSSIECTPRNSVPEEVILRFSQSLFDMYKKQGLPKSWLHSALVRVKFALPEDGDSSSQAYLGDLFTCTVVLEDDLGKERSASTIGRCRVHNPAHERISARIYNL